MPSYYVNYMRLALTRATGHVCETCGRPIMAGQDYRVRSGFVSPQRAYHESCLLRPRLGSYLSVPDGLDIKVTYEGEEWNKP